MSVVPNVMQQEHEARGRWEHGGGRENGGKKNMITESWFYFPLSGGLEKGWSPQKEFVPPPPLLFRKMSNPDLSPAATAATKSKLHRQLSQDESWGRRSSLAMTGKQLLPLSSSLHAGVSQMAWQGPSGAFIGHGATGGLSAGDGNNLVRMRSQSLGQSAPSLTGLPHSSALFLSVTVSFSLAQILNQQKYRENGVKDPRIDRAIGVCKKAVSAFSYSWKKRRDMSEVQAELGLPTHQLITESPTRWGSRQRMIERFLEQEKALVRVLGSDKKSRHLEPTWQDLDVLESINKAVKPLQEFTDALSGEFYVSVSYIKPVLHLFKTSLLQPEEEDAELTKTIKGKIMRYLDDKYSDPVKDELLDMSSLVDPRFRTTYIDPDKVEPVKKRAVAEMMSLPAPANNSTPQQPGTAVQVRQEDAQPPPKKKMTLAAFFKKNPVSSPNQSEAEKIETELKSFLLTPEVDPDTNPLEWWKRHQPNFPRLSVLQGLTLTF
ncbi:Microtubule-associated serine/threonine-protein kinase 2 [Dissostichus eleginoides]|uniref:Microtubule-associated serine/threonine-protein kinase 2 n=1 Tax=Dissostichus eleginoides TaxID=100907 RepID=A0AAD9CDH9_DISEL|nr:Microtubule-associated serine/threonine-protein kinase 2 [Dissostichus eleginoides]